MVPPREFYDQGIALWILLYRLRMALRARLDRLAGLLHTYSCKCMQAEANACVNLALKAIVLFYADGLMVCGDKPAINGLKATLSNSL